MNLGQFTEPQLLMPCLASEWRDSAISELSQRLESSGRVEDIAAFIRAALSHEWLVSMVFDGVAFSLARERGVRELSFAMGLSQRGVCWSVDRTAVVDTVVLFAVPLTDDQRYLSLVLTFSTFLKDKVASAALRRCTQGEEMWSVLRNFRSVSTGPHEPDAGHN